MLRSSIGVLVFLVALAVFWFSPVHQISDSDFSMLLSQNLIEHGSFQLDRYLIPRPQPVTQHDHVEIGKYQLELVNDHVYYFFPPGTSLLSLPYVALLKVFGINATDESGTHGELTIQTSLAALLMAVLALVIFSTSRLLLSEVWSAVIALGLVFGSQVWSTASRGLWSHTWNLLLLVLVIFLLVRVESRKHSLRPVLLASLLAWAYFVRPTSSIALAMIGLYVFLYYRRSIAVYAMTLAAWFTGFFIYSWHNFGKLLPSYYAANRLDFAVFKTALAGNLLSPSRGLLIYAPWIFFTTYLLVRYRRYLSLRRLVWLSLAILAGDLIVASAFSFWWGGLSYGPRLTTDLVPWLVLLSILAVQAWLRSRDEQPGKNSFIWKAELWAGALLLAFSVFANGRGAMSASTLRWSEYPRDDAGIQAKIWDWRQAQFLAGLVEPTLPRNFSPIANATVIDMASPDADRYLWLGWGLPENGFRWTTGKEARLVFGLEAVDDLALQMNVAPLLVSGKVNEQVLQIELNGRLLNSAVLNKQEYVDLTVTLPRAALQKQNVLTFRLPQATSPESLGLSIDQRQLGLAVKRLEFRRLSNAWL
jgi:hypothetical protein